jgi:hypothetical protein
VTDLPLETLWAKVAQATGGTWRTTPKGRHLVARPKQDATAVAKYEDAKKSFEKTFPIQLSDKPWTVSEVRAEIDEAVKAVRSMPERADYQVIQPFVNRSPSGRLTSRVVRALGLREVISVPPGQRVVWSSSPTAMQRQLPAASLAALQAYNDEVRNHQAALQDAGVTEEDRGQYWLPLLQPDSAREGDGLLVAVKHDFGYYNVTVRLLGGEGYARWQTGFPIAGQPENPGATVTLPFEVPEEPLRLSDLSRTIYRMGESRGQARDPEAMAALRAELANLEASLLPGSVNSDMFDQTAQATGLDVVASFPFAIGLFSSGYMGTGEPDLRKAWQSALGGMQILRAEVDGGVLTVTSGDVFIYFLADMTRKTAAFAAKAANDGVVSLDEAVAIAMTSKSRGDLMGASFVLQFADPGLAGQASQAINERSLLRVYGQLDENAKRQARSGGLTLRFSALPPKVAQEYRVLVFVDQPDLAYSMEGGNVNRDWDEPTIGLANGFPADGTLTIKFEAPQGVLSFTEYEGGYTYARATEPQQVASGIAWAEVGGEDVGRTTYALAKYEKLTVSGVFGSGFTHMVSATMIPSIPADQRTGWDKLPAETKAEIEKHLAESRKAFAEYRGRTRPAGRIRP